jgi:hypothetical protein
LRAEVFALLAAFFLLKFSLLFSLFFFLLEKMSAADLVFPPEPVQEPAGPSRDELLKRLRAKTNRRPGQQQPGSKQPMGNISALTAQLAEYTNMDESVIKTMIQETGIKKMAKNPLKFARKVVDALPAMQALKK